MMPTTRTVRLLLLLLATAGGAAPVHAQVRDLAVAG